MTTVILFVFGTVIGSFLNVVALRLNSGLTLSGRSKCPHCGKILKYYELVPVFSFLFSGRRCRGCKALISWQYPLVEILTGLVFATIFNFVFAIYREFSFELLYTCAFLFTIFSLYIAITIYDFRHKIIPDSLVYPAIALSALFRILSGGEGLDYFAGIILALFFASVWLLSRGRAMGFGDAKLALSVGLVLGAAAGFSAIVLSFWIGAAAGLGLMFFQKYNPLSSQGKQITIKSEIPFAPFIVMGAWLALILNLDLLHVSIF